MKDQEVKEIIESRVYKAIGTASACWSQLPEGVFDSTKAKEVADELIEFITSLMFTTSTLDIPSPSIEIVPEEDWVCWWCNKQYPAMITRNTHVEDEHPNDPAIKSWIERGRPL